MQFFAPHTSSKAGECNIVGNFQTFGTWTFGTQGICFQNKNGQNKDATGIFGNDSKPITDVSSVPEWMQRKENGLTLVIPGVEMWNGELHQIFNNAKYFNNMLYIARASWIE